MTIETKRKQFSSGIYIKETSWNNLAQKAKGTSKDAIHINNSLDTTRQQLNKTFDDLQKEREHFILDEVYNRYTGADKEYKTLLQAFTYHNEKVQSLIGKDYVKNYFIIMYGAKIVSRTINGTFSSDNSLHKVSCTVISLQGSMAASLFKRCIH